MMDSLYTKRYREEPHVPVLYAYYDRADMLKSTKGHTNHAHSLIEIMYVAEGELTLFVEDEPVKLGRRQLILIDSRVYHHSLLMGTDAPLSMMNIEFQLEPSDARCPPISGLSSAHPALADWLEHPVKYLVITDPDDAIYSLIKQIILLGDSLHIGAEKLCSYLIAQVMLLIAGRRRAEGERGSEPIRNQYVSRALDELKRRRDEPITAQALARELGIQPTYLHRLFKEHTGMTIREHIQWLRKKGDAAEGNGHGSAEPTPVP